MSRASAVLLLAVLPAGCGRYEPPPPHTAYGGLPVSGSLADARFAGFRACTSGTATLRCRRNGMFVLGQGPFQAAVDLNRTDGSRGFDQLTFWDDRDQYAVYAIADELQRRGWLSCYTGQDMRGDQMIFTRAGEPVKFSMDLSYWGKRRFRVLPVWNRRERSCAPS